MARTINEIKFGIHDQIAREQISIDVFNHLTKVFRPYVGKKITQRMITTLNKNLPDGFASARLKRIASLIQVVLMPNLFSCSERKLPAPMDTQRQYENRLTFLLGYESYDGKTNGTIFQIGSSLSEHSGFAYYNNCYGNAARERNAIRRVLLGKVNKIQELNDTYITGKAIADVAKSSLIKLVGYQMEAEITKLLGMTVEK